ncbi:MAG: 4'-phosphopantetheinyl transferase, partial [Pseudomonas sp.]
ALDPRVRQQCYFQDAELLGYDPAGLAQLQLLRDLGPDWPAGSRCDGQFVRLSERVLSLVSIAT